MNKLIRILIISFVSSILYISMSSYFSSSVIGKENSILNDINVFQDIESRDLKSKNINLYKYTKKERENEILDLEMNEKIPFIKTAKEGNSSFVRIAKYDLTANITTFVYLIGVFIIFTIFYIFLMFDLKNIKRFNSKILALTIIYLASEFFLLVFYMSYYSGLIVSQNKLIIIDFISSLLILFSIIIIAVKLFYKEDKNINIFNAFFVLIFCLMFLSTIQFKNEISDFISKNKISFKNGINIEEKTLDNKKEIILLNIYIKAALSGNDFAKEKLQIYKDTSPKTISTAFKNIYSNDISKYDLLSITDENNEKVIDYVFSNYISLEQFLPSGFDVDEFQQELNGLYLKYRLLSNSISKIESNKIKENDIKREYILNIKEDFESYKKITQEYEKKLKELNKYKDLKYFNPKFYEEIATILSIYNESKRDDISEKLKKSGTEFLYYPMSKKDLIENACYNNICTIAKLDKNFNKMSRDIVERSLVDIKNNVIESYNNYLKIKYTKNNYIKETLLLKNIYSENKNISKILELAENNKNKIKLIKDKDIEILDISINNWLSKKSINNFYKDISSGLGFELSNVDVEESLIKFENFKKDKTKMKMLVWSETINNMIPFPDKSYHIPFDLNKKDFFNNRSVKFYILEKNKDDYKNIFDIKNIDIYSVVSSDNPKEVLLPEILKIQKNLLIDIINLENKDIKNKELETIINTKIKEYTIVAILIYLSIYSMLFHIVTSICKQIKLSRKTYSIILCIFLSSVIYITIKPTLSFLMDTTVLTLEDNIIDNPKFKNKD